ncbi:MAG: hypothetical protein FWC15_09380 [Fibromonadales bacterium]|nr:hypothetical protein [Fibromonadales bacterium]
MKTLNLRKSLVAANLLFAMTFTLSCSSDDDNETIGTCNGIKYNTAHFHCDIYGTIQEGAEDSNGGSSSSPSCDNASTGLATVTCGGQTYKTVQIGNQTWMAENLNYYVSGSACYDNESSNCAVYGRLYNWATAMDLQSCNYRICASQIQSKHQGICPEGWHIPSEDDWSKLFDYVGGSSVAGKHLKEDTYGFSALLGGGCADCHGYDGYSYRGFSYGGNLGNWWSSGELFEDAAYSRGIRNDDDFAIRYENMKADLWSVRCLLD